MWAWKKSVQGASIYPFHGCAHPSLSLAIGGARREKMHRREERLSEAVTDAYKAHAHVGRRPPTQGRGGVCEGKRCPRLEASSWLIRLKGPTASRISLRVMVRSFAHPGRQGAGIIGSDGDMER